MLYAIMCNFILIHDQKQSPVPYLFVIFSNICLIPRDLILIQSPFDFTRSDTDEYISSLKKVGRQMLNSFMPIEAKTAR